QPYYQTPSHLVTAGVVLSLVDIIAVSLRFLARRNQKQHMGYDDCLMVVATTLTLVVAMSIVYGVSQQALGYPLSIPPDFEGSLSDFSSDQLRLTTKLEYGYAIILPLALGCTEMSIVLFYMRIFSITSASLTHRLLVIFSVLILLWTAGFCLATIFQCGFNMWAIWSTASSFVEYCPNSMLIDVALCVSDFIADVLLAIFPIPLIWSLKLSTKNKLTASAVFSLGAIAVVASFLRLAMKTRMTTRGLDPTGDEILIITEYMYWGMVECGTGIFAACLPICQSLFRKNNIPSWLSSIVFQRPWALLSGLNLTQKRLETLNKSQ
ncbi:hypothetical protein V8F20_010656, partial [Naviculisporaceae sp. PSN 640]